MVALYSGLRCGSEEGCPHHGGAGQDGGEGAVDECASAGGETFGASVVSVSVEPCASVEDEGGGAEGERCQADRGLCRGSSLGAAADASVLAFGGG